MLLTTIPIYHFEHEKLFDAKGLVFNQSILRAVDEVQKSAPEGGGYFIGVKAVPAESPIGYNLCFFGRELLNAPRTTSYCSGASYAAFMTALQEILEHRPEDLSETVLEAIRLQEPDGSRREDMVKMWGWWNADGPGSLYALTQFSSMGIRIKPEDAVAGDFCNINWVKGPGHSVVFLRWEKTDDGQPGMRFWSSQKSTNGLGDLVVPLSSISGFVFTRLTAPQNLFALDTNKQMKREKAVYDVPNPALGSR